MKDAAPTAPVHHVDGSLVSALALEMRGIPYRDGGDDLKGFDCSGLVQYVYRLHGVLLPRAVAGQFTVGQPADAADVKPGDLVFFSTVSRGPSHVGIAIGGGRFVHAPNARGVVRIEELSARYWAERFVGARRVGE